MVIFEPSSGRELVCNAARAGKRFVPASTFKIAHTLIALETGTISGIDEVFAWDGRDRGVAAWNQDLSVREAVSASAVWVFQGIATRIGHASESEWVRKLDYGNEDIGDVDALRHFWLYGPLAISAKEQIGFLMHLKTGQLPASEKAMEQVIAALKLETSSSEGAVYGKTGAMLPIDDAGFLKDSDAEFFQGGAERTGWFVGWIDRPEIHGGPVYFAVNLDLALPGAMAARTSAAYAILNANGFSVGD